MDRKKVNSESEMDSENAEVRIGNGSEKSSKKRELRIGKESIKRRQNKRTKHLLFMRIFTKRFHRDERGGEYRRSNTTHVVEFDDVMAISNIQGDNANMQSKETSSGLRKRRKC
ncbi:hypothetical protein OSB04_un001055 [Centaurea solstitialis]|uniref:Uncharacterized protein n=1 Tax=Centaurea solstitialis TaxID=347529 RepID=A0AA38S4S0_9ASTR|nr:hypothetical protein OSB04_un001055 [Centaurea solstitialis]